MTWLIAHMWIVVGGAVVLSLLLGWSLRGVFLVGRLRRAEVERELTKVELSEAREEIERLFAAQRKMAATPGAAPEQVDPALQQQLAEAAAELQAVRAELEALKAAPPVVAAAAPVAAAAVPGLIAAEAHDALKQHAASLETEIATLQASLAEARAAAAAPKAETPAGVAPEVFEALANRAAELEAALKAAEAARAAAEAAKPAVAAVPVADAKLVWQADYLRQRAQALEAELLRQPQAVAAAPVVEAPPPEPKPEPAPAPAAAPAAAEEDSVEQELARLRWRNRYLEGRLAYLEGDAESVAEELAEEGTSAVAEPEPARASETILGQLEAADAKAEAEQVEPVKPMPIDKPFGGVADDLTQIGGIGPKIQDVLNSLGIFHYDQIAEWTPENVAWVDQYLNFEGRISREGWVEQAAVLVGEEADA